MLPSLVTSSAALDFTVSASSPSVSDRLAVVPRFTKRAPMLYTVVDAPSSACALKAPHWPLSDMAFMMAPSSYLKVLYVGLAVCVCAHTGTASAAPARHTNKIFLM